MHLQGGVLTGAPPVHGAEMALFLWGILTFIFFMQTIIINAALAVRLTSSIRVLNIGLIEELMIQIRSNAVPTHL